MHHPLARHYITTQGNLIIDGVGAGDAGLYQCAATNKVLDQTVTLPHAVDLVVLRMPTYVEGILLSRNRIPVYLQGILFSTLQI